MANRYNMALMCVRLGRLEEAARQLSQGHAEGVFYSKWGFGGAVWEPLRKLESFARAEARNNGMIREAERKSAMKWEVSEPAGYDPSRPYPLFLALHGGGENLAEFKPQWTSKKLQGEFLTAYVQSSQVASMDGYHWQGEETTRRDLARAWREITARRRVDPSRVVIGGFSSGGFATMLAIFDGAPPARGFVILCPELPADPGAEELERALKRGVRGTLISTGQDRRLERQKQYVEFLAGKGLNVNMVVKPNIGHWYPPDLGELIDRALGEILK
jgi:dienelactone hydrolase